MTVPIGHDWLKWPWLVMTAHDWPDWPWLAWLAMSGYVCPWLAMTGHGWPSLAKLLIAVLDFLNLVLYRPFIWKSGSIYSRFNCLSTKFSQLDVVRFLKYFEFIHKIEPCFCTIFWNSRSIKFRHYSNLKHSGDVLGAQVSRWLGSKDKILHLFYCWEGRLLVLAIYAGLARTPHVKCNIFQYFLTS